MSKHNFTPKQSERILNVISDLLMPDDHFYRYAKHITELFNNQVRNMVATDKETGSEELTLSADNIHNMAIDNLYPQICSMPWRMQLTNN